MLHPLLNEKDRKPPEIRDIRTDGESAFFEKSKAVLDALETLRKGKLRSYTWRRKIAIPLAMVLTPCLGFIDILLLKMQAGEEDKAAGLTFLFLGALYTWVTSPKRQYAKAYKQKILPELARLFGDFQYVLKGGIDIEKIRPSQILPSHDRYETEDYFRGTYKGVNIEFSEAKLTERRGSGKNRHTVTVFKGLVIFLTIASKKFHGRTILEKDRLKPAQWLKEKSSGMNRANLVDPEFEKIFDVYTNDQVEARYLIDPVMIERFKALYAEYDRKSLSASFYENKLLILVETNRNHFEPADLHIPAADPASVLHMKNEIGQILSLVDKLNLYDPETHR